MYLRDALPSSMPRADAEYVDDTGTIPEDFGGSTALRPAPVNMAGMRGRYGMSGLSDDYDLIYQRTTDSSCATWMANLHRRDKSGETLYYGDKTAAQCIQNALNNPSLFNINGCCYQMPGWKPGDSGKGTDPGDPDFDSGTPSGGKCANAGGTCIDTNNYSCSTTPKTGYCPGASNIRCCVGTVKKKGTAGRIPTGPAKPPPSEPTSIPSGVNTASFSNGALWVLGGIAVTMLVNHLSK